MSGTTKVIFFPHKNFECIFSSFFLSESIISRPGLSLQLVTQSSLVTSLEQGLSVTVLALVMSLSWTESRAGRFIFILCCTLGLVEINNQKILQGNVMGLRISNFCSKMILNCVRNKVDFLVFANHLAVHCVSQQGDGLWPWLLALVAYNR